MDARGRQDEHLEIQKIKFGPHVTIFNFLDVRPFPPRGFFTFLVALAHSVAAHVLQHTDCAEIPKQCYQKTPDFPVLKVKICSMTEFRAGNIGILQD